MTVKHRSYLLELCSPADFRPAPFPVDAVALTGLRSAELSRARRLWIEVGRGFWTERHEWSAARWQRHLDDGKVSFQAAVLNGDDLGFFELRVERDEAKLEGFGLLPAWRGRGFGAGLLSAATQQAFDARARRIWLHTATDDHPHALPNYRARGYRVYHEEALEDRMLEPPEPDPEP